MFEVNPNVAAEDRAILGSMHPGMISDVKEIIAAGYRLQLITGLFRVETLDAGYTPNPVYETQVKTWVAWEELARLWRE